MAAHKLLGRPPNHELGAHLTPSHKRSGDTMDLLDRLLAHDSWTTHQLLLACQALPDDLLDKEFDIDQRSLRKTFVHIIENMEVWTDLLGERPVQNRTGNSVSELLARLNTISRDFANIARGVAREQRYDACF